MKQESLIVLLLLEETRTVPLTFLYRYQWVVRGMIFTYTKSLFAKRSLFMILQVVSSAKTANPRGPLWYALPQLPRHWQQLTLVAKVWPLRHQVLCKGRRPRRLRQCRLLPSSRVQTKPSPAASLLCPTTNSGILVLLTRWRLSEPETAPARARRRQVVLCLRLQLLKYLQRFPNSNFVEEQSDFESLEKC